MELKLAKVIFDFD